MALTRKLLLALSTLTLLLTPTVIAQSELTILQTEAPRSMDPADQTATYTAAVLYPMYEGLVEPTDNQEIKPGLATDWDTNADGTIWTFTIREGVTFHDGTALSADAVKASFDRLLDPDAGLAGAGRFQNVIDSVDVTGDNQVTFSLKTPYPAFLALLSTSQAAVVSPTAADSGTLGRHAVGTGPYKFVAWDSGERVVMESYDNYWGDAPEVNRLVWTWSPEDAVMTMSVQAGAADIVNPLPPVYAQTLEANPQVTVMQEDGSAVFWVALNTKLAPLDDVRVRQALNYATNKQGLVNALLRGYGVPANSPLAPPNFGYDASVEGYPYSPERARELLAEAGYDNGITINLAVQEADSDTAEALQGMWAEVGIHLNIQQMESGVWSDAAFATPEQKAEQGVHAVFASWSTGTLDADGQLRPLYHTDSWAPSGANLGFYSNPKLDAILDEAASITDTERRAELYAQAQRIINQDAAHVLLYYPVALAAHRSNVGGFWLSPGSQLMIRHPTID